MANKYCGDLRRRRNRKSCAEKCQNSGLAKIPLAPPWRKPEEGRKAVAFRGIKNRVFSGHDLLCFTESAPQPFYARRWLPDRNIRKKTQSSQNLAAAPWRKTGGGAGGRGAALESATTAERAVGQRKDNNKHSNNNNVNANNYNNNIKINTANLETTVVIDCRACSRSICLCHPCAGAMLFCSVSLQF